MICALGQLVYDLCPLAVFGHMITAIGIIQGVASMLAWNAYFQKLNLL